MNKAKEISALREQIKQQIGELVGLCCEVEDHAEVTADAYQRGYENGFIAGHLKAEKSGQSFYEDGYQRGLSDAWECARKIVTMPNRGFINSDILDLDPGESIFTKYTSAEAIEKIRQYEQEKEESKKRAVCSAEDVMRQYLDMFCTGRRCTGCPLHTQDFTCGRGYHFLTAEAVSDEEVRRAYAKVL